MKRCLIILILLLPAVVKAQIITTFAGGGTVSLGDSGPATAANIPDPVNGLFDKNGNYYIASCASGNRIRKIDTAGIITTVAGTGTLGYSMDGIPATSAELNLPNDVILDTAGNLYFSEGGVSNRVRRVDKVTGIITTVAGNGTHGFSGDGFPATAAQLYDPLSICFDKFGNLYIADDINYRVRKVDPSGIITTFAGTGTPGYSGDGSLADTCKVGLVQSLCADTAGNIYLGDNSNSRVFKVNTAGYITTVAGTDTGYYYDGDGVPATAANISPNLIGLDDSGHLFIAEVPNWRVRKVDEAGIIHTVAGDGILGYSGDGGPATAAELNHPNGIAFDACGNLYVPEANDGRIRKILFNSIVTTPTISLSGIVSAAVGSTVTLTATVASAGSSYIIYWMNHGVEFTTTTGPSVTYTKPAGIDTITAKIVPTGYGCYDSAISGQHIIAISHTAVNNVAQSGLSVYPNPASDIIYVDGLQAAAGYRVLSIVGKEVQQGNLSAGSNIISVQSLSPGMYMLEINNEDGGKVVTRIVKQ